MIGGGFVPKLHGVTKFGPVCVASLADMVLMKALAYQSREETKDFDDLKFALRVMVEKEETFKQYRFQGSEIETIKETVRAKNDNEARTLLRQLGE